MTPTELLTNNRYLCEHFNQEEYPLCFQRYLTAVQPYFEEREAWPPSSFAAEAAEVLQEVQRAAAARRWKFQRDASVDNDKIVLLLFLAPAAMEIGTPAAIAFADALAAAWNAAYPDSPFKVGRYENIVEGFKWKISFTL